jgi:CheY-like chemotaxis protein
MTFSLKNVLAAMFSKSSAVDCNGNWSAQETEPKSCRQTTTILCVDDEPSILSMRRLIFESLGYVVLTATGGESALALVAMHRVDAVVLDYLMPGMDGGETAHRLRNMRSDIPLILSSGCLTIPERVLKIVDAVVEKAAGPEVLIEALARQLAQTNPTKPASIIAKIRITAFDSDNAAIC